MNQDDTFRKLKQIPFEQLQDLHARCILNTLRHCLAPVNDALVYEDHGWTRKEFLNEWAQRLPKLD